MCLMYWNSYVFSSDLAAGVRRDLLDAVVAAAARRRIDELRVVDDDQAQPVLTLQAPGPRAELRHRQRRGVVDEQLEAVQRLRDREDPVILLLPHVAAPYRVRAHMRLLGNDAGGELLGRHLERAEGDRPVLVAPGPDRKSGG